MQAPGSAAEDFLDLGFELASRRLFEAVRALATAKGIKAGGGVFNAPGALVEVA